MSVLVTGSTGFIGSNLTLHLERLGHTVTAIGKLHEHDLGVFKKGDSIK